MNPRITNDLNILTGKPVIRNTRIPVSLVMNLLASGYTAERILEAYPVLEKADIAAALEYAGKLMEREEIYQLAPAAAHA